MGNFPLAPDRSYPRQHQRSHQWHALRSPDHGGRLHRLGQQFRGFILGKREHHHQRCGPLIAELFHGKHDTHEGRRHERKHGERERRGRHLLGDLSNLALRTFVWKHGRRNRWYADRLANHGCYLHGLGQQFRWIRLDHPEHHHQRRPSQHHRVRRPRLDAGKRHSHDDHHAGHRWRDRHIMGHQPLHPQRFVVQLNHRCDQWHALGVADDGRKLYHLGEQFGWVNLYPVQHHHQ